MKKIIDYIDSHAWTWWAIAAISCLAFAQVAETAYSSIHDGANLWSDIRAAK